jgi:hypothetical protein
LRGLDGSGSRLDDMDVVAIAIGLAAFAILLGVVRLIERI